MTMFVDVTDVRAVFQTPDGSTILATLTGSDTIGSVDIERGVGQSIGSADVSLVDSSLPLDSMTMGNRVRIDVQSPHYPETWHTLGLTRVASRDISVEGEYVVADVPLSNYVFSILRDRLFTGRVDDEPVDQAVEEVVTQSADELSVSFQQPESASIPTRTATFSGQRALDVVGELTGSETAIYADEETLVLRPMPSTTTTTLTPSDISNPTYQTTGEPTTRFRVQGGEINIPVDGVGQPNGPEYRSLLGDDGEPRALYVQLDRMPTTEVSRLSLHTRHTGVDANLVVRLHPDDDGEPRDPTDPNAALAKRTLDGNFVAEDGPTDVLFPDHTFTGDPWVIVTQSTENSGGAFELRAEPTFGFNRPAAPMVTDVRAPQPIVTVVEDEQAVAEYGVREGVISRDSIDSFDEAVQVGESRLSKQSTPREEVAVEARSAVTHDLALLDVVDLEVPALWAGTKTFLVTERTSVLENSRLKTELTLSQPAGF